MRRISEEAIMVIGMMQIFRPGVEYGRAVIDKIHEDMGDEVYMETPLEHARGFWEVVGIDELR